MDREIIINTLELNDLIENGYEVELVGITSDIELLNDGYTDEDKDLFLSHRSGMIVDFVEFDCEEEVQCISVTGSDHLYLTNDFIATHNTNNIMYLKSTDDTMIDTLSKMSGTTHKVYTDSKTVTKDMQRLIFPTEGKVSYTSNAKEMPVISYNDFAYIPRSNSIVLRAGDSPIWNRNETCLPMSWRLFQNTIQKPGMDITLQTVPTLSTAMDFDVRKNQPNFDTMLEKRLAQAMHAENVQEVYKNIYSYTDHDVSLLDPDNYSDQIMSMISDVLSEDVDGYDDMLGSDEFESVFGGLLSGAEENDDVINAIKDSEMKVLDDKKPRYAGGRITRYDLAPVTSGGSVNHSLDGILIRAFQDTRYKLYQDDEYFSQGDKGQLLSKDGDVFIDVKSDDVHAKMLDDMAKEEDSRIYAEGDVVAKSSFVVTDNFIKFLVSLESWDFANGDFDKKVNQIINADMN